MVCPLVRQSAQEASSHSYVVRCATHHQACCLKSGAGPGCFSLTSWLHVGRSTRQAVRAGSGGSAASASSRRSELYPTWGSGAGRCSCICLPSGGHTSTACQASLFHLLFYASVEKNALENCRKCRLAVSSVRAHIEELAGRLCSDLIFCWAMQKPHTGRRRPALGSRARTPHPGHPRTGCRAVRQARAAAAGWGAGEAAPAQASRASTGGPWGAAWADGAPAAAP